MSSTVGGEEEVPSDAESLADSTASSEAATAALVAGASRRPQLATLSASLGEFLAGTCSLTMT